MINILIQHSVSDMYSGASYSLIGLVKQLKEDGKYNPIVVVPRKNGTLEKELKKINVECYPIEQHDMWSVDLGHAHTLKNFIKEILVPLRSRHGYNAIRKLLIRKNIKLVHINMLTCGMAAEVANELQIPVVWHMREFLEEDIGAKILWPNKRRKIINNSDELIAISNAVKNKFKKEFNPEIRVIYNGIDFNINNIKSNNILRHSKVKIAIVGRVCKNKGQFELIRALEELYCNNNLQYDLFIYGNIQEKEYFNEILEFVKKQNASSRIHYEGRTSNTIVTLNDIDILAVCSSMEAFGRTTIEGMLAGCLLIGSASGGTKELIMNNVNGLKYESHNINSLAKTILEAVNNKQNSRKLAVNGQKFAIENFSVKKNAEMIEQVYDEVLLSNLK